MPLIVFLLEWLAIYLAIRFVCWMFGIKTRLTSPIQVLVGKEEVTYDEFRSPGH